MAGGLMKYTPPVKENAFEAQVLQYAHLMGWIGAHFRPARTKVGEWRTPVAGDAEGYPDWTFVRERVLWAELKGSRGELTAEEYFWLLALIDAGQEVYLWYPDDWDEIKEVMAKPGMKVY